MSTIVKKSLYTEIVENTGMLLRNTLQPLLLPIVHKNLMPDAILRYGIRRELEMELQRIKMMSAEERMAAKMKFLEEIKGMPIAIATDKANEQHYEVPDEFYQTVLGPRLKYSSCYYPTPETTLAEAEIHMLDMYCERAGIEDGMSLVDLGCGWGSVTLYMAEKYPNCKVTSISNSNSQREFIMGTAAKRGLKNVNVFTGDIKEFDLPAEYKGHADRVISIEMFEHMKNYELLMAKVASWIKPGGKLFIHIFTHVEVPGHFTDSWMADNFFTGGSLPSDDTLLFFQNDLRIEKQWRVNGKHYQRTLEDWCAIMDSKKDIVLPMLASAYGQGKEVEWYVNWRLFFIACAEFFGMRDGNEYLVSHYLFTKP